MSSAAWRHTLDSLGAGLQPNSATGGKVRSFVRPNFSAPGVNAACRGDSPIANSSTAKLKILERSSPTSLAVYWCDATLGKYCEQPWKLSVARRVSTCALSGERIRRGDKVFKPFGRGRMPANADQSILASAVERSGSLCRVDVWSPDGPDSYSTR
jgi:hypothetical protein